MPGRPPQTRDPRITILRAGAIATAVVSGIGALVAFIAGSPLEFGIALALCGAGWVAADFIEATAEAEHAVRPSAVPVERLNPGYVSGHVVYFGGNECFPPPSAAGRSAA